MQDKVYTVPELPAHMIEIIRKHADKQPVKRYVWEKDNEL